MAHVPAGGGRDRRDGRSFLILSIDWLTEAAEEGLCEYVHGLDGNGGSGGLGMDEHIESLVYITRLASMTGRSE